MSSTTTTARDTAAVTLHEDGTAEVVIDGAVQTVTAADVDDARGQATRLVVAAAARQGRPVAFTAADRDQTWQLVAHPDGLVAPAEESPSAPPRRERGRTGLVIASAVAGLAVVACAVIAGASQSAVDDAHRETTTARHQAEQDHAELIAQLDDEKKKASAAAAAQKAAEQKADAAQKAAATADERAKAAQVAKSKAERALAAEKKAAKTKDK